MTTRTSKRTVTFKRPFFLQSFDRELPAGDYQVKTDEEFMEGASFPAYRRTLTTIQLYPVSGRPGETLPLTVDPNELNTALERDRSQSESLSQPEADPKSRESQTYRSADFEDQRHESRVQRVHRDRKKAFFGLRQSERFRTHNGN